VSAPTIYSPQEVADLLTVSRETVLRKCREGKWPHRRPTAQTIVFTDEDLATILDMSRAGSLTGARQPDERGK
jgi:excisionase family DNA binding protein